MAGFYDAPFTVAVILLTSIQGSNGRYDKSNEGRIKDHIFNHPNYSVTDRPALDSSDTVNVSMAMTIFGMLDLNERDQVITTASWLKLRWHDARLQWNPTEFGGVDHLNVPNTEIWIPKIFIGNALDHASLKLVSPDRGSTIITSDGFASLGSPMVMSTQCQIYIKYFPYDTQACQFSFFPENIMEEKLRLSTVDTAGISEIGSREWQLIKFTNIGYSVTFYDWAPGIPEANSSLGLFCLYLQRNPSHYIRTLWIPSSVLCLMALVTFLAPPDSGERISLGVSMVLGLTVFQLLVADILPTSSEDPPILSNYLSLNFIMACMTVPLSLMNINIAYGDSRVFFIRNASSRKLFLEYLPRWAGIPSYSQRILGLDNKVRKKVEKEVAQTEEHTPDSEKQETTAMACAAVEEEMSPAEKTKIELRTVALVMDRLLVLVFLVAFVVLLTATLLEFQKNPGAPEDIQTLCG